MRSIDEIILHCTATREGKEVSVGEIDQWHRDRGWSGIGYHFVVHLDGTVSDGRPVAKVGAHVKGHNSTSIGVVYVGGVDANGVAKDTRTAAQKDALAKLIQDLDARYSFQKLSGHNEYANKACPCFDVSVYQSLLNAPNSTFAAAGDQLLKVGDQGPAVRAWRQYLANAGFDIPVSDVFDELTDQITRFFQAKRKIVIDGIVGPQTLLEMERLIEGLEPFEAMSQVVTDLTLFETKAVKVMDDLIRDFGISVEDAAAILGNIGHECAGFKHLQQIGGTAYGWPQWDGVRREAYFKWCKDNGLNKASDEANYGYLVLELKGTEKKAFKHLDDAQGLDAKTIAFEKSFERAGVKHYESRIAYAQKALEAYRTAKSGQPIGEIADGVVSTISSIQKVLNFLGGNAGLVDGIFGPKTEAAIRKFERVTRLPETGKASPTVKAALQAVYFALGGK
jgi:peptidoglycan hydrolase-like protein with peptidoglycan-binding domain